MSDVTVQCIVRIKTSFSGDLRDKIYLWNPLSLKKTCHFSWLSVKTFCNATVEAGLTPGHVRGESDDGGVLDGTGNRTSSELVEAEDILVAKMVMNLMVRRVFANLL